MNFLTTLPKCPTHGAQMELRPLYRQTREQKWCGAWYDCMAKEAARLFLKVTNVRAERVQDISEQDAESEGIGVLFRDVIAYSDNPKYRSQFIDWNMENPLAILQFELF